MDDQPETHAQRCERELKEQAEMRKRVLEDSARYEEAVKNASEPAPEETPPTRRR